MDLTRLQKKVNTIKMVSQNIQIRTKFFNHSILKLSSQKFMKNLINKISKNSIN